MEEGVHDQAHHPWSVEVIGEKTETNHLSLFCANNIQYIPYPHVSPPVCIVRNLVLIMGSTHTERGEKMNNPKVGIVSIVFKDNTTLDIELSKSPFKEFLDMKNALIAGEPFIGDMYHVIPSCNIKYMSFSY